MRYIPQVKKNLISVGALKALGHGISIRDGVLKMTRGSMVVLKGVRHNNLHYLIGSTVTGRVTTYIFSGYVCIHIWHMRPGHTGEKSLQALAKKKSLKCASTCNMELDGYDVLDKKTKVNLVPPLIARKVFLIVLVSIWGPAKTTLLGGHWYFISFIDILSRHCWIYPMR